eukprot:scaffold34537_cov27-Tisochrysis_lutea.AAC.5
MGERSGPQLAFHCDGPCQGWVMRVAVHLQQWSLETDAPPIAEQSTRLLCPHKDTAMDASCHDEAPVGRVARPNLVVSGSVAGVLRSKVVEARVESQERARPQLKEQTAFVRVDGERVDGRTAQFLFVQSLIAPARGARQSSGQGGRASRPCGHIYRPYGRNAKGTPELARADLPNLDDAFGVAREAEGAVYPPHDCIDASIVLHFERDERPRLAIPQPDGAVGGARDDERAAR